MQNFFVYDSQVQGENIYIEGTDVNHIVIRASGFL